MGGRAAFSDLAEFPLGKRIRPGGGVFRTVRRVSNKCARQDLNLHGRLRPLASETSLSANSNTRARQGPSGPEAHGVETIFISRLGRNFKPRNAHLPPCQLENPATRVLSNPRRRT